MIRSDGIESVARYCEANVSWLVRQLRSDARRNGPLTFWGRSRNLDELAGDTIVASEILDLLSAITTKPLSHKTPHAGLQHTYGYLFSTLETEYGFKRERWLRPDIADAFGFDSSALGPTPDAGTLLANTTAFGGRFAFRNCEDPFSRLQNRLKDHAAADLLEFQVEGSQHVRVLESVQHSWRGKHLLWQFQTDLVDRGNLSILIYSLKNLTTSQHDLITLFPIQAATKTEILERAAAGTLEDIRLRFNGYVPGMVGRDFSGSVALEEF